MNIIENALKEGRSNLSEYESKLILESYGIPITRERIVNDQQDLTAAIGEIAFPLVIKGCAPLLNHKTERNLVRLDIRSEAEAVLVVKEFMDELKDDGGSVLVQEMIKGKRELVAGLVRDSQFGPCVMFGLGGILTEVLKDVVFLPAPLNHKQALTMIGSIRSKKLLGPIRGMLSVDLDQLADILVKVGQIGMENDQIKEIDINPIIINGSRPVAVDALVILNI